MTKENRKTDGTITKETDKLPPPNPTSELRENIPIWGTSIGYAAGRSVTVLFRAFRYSGFGC